ncbi:TBC1 domain family member 24 [Pelomyxa schiedti]|nr:TBC1 domain family member 24 [Pelomyxa schiedti]
MDSFELLPDVKKENDVLLRSPMYDGVVDPHMNVLWKNIPIPGDCAGAKSRLKVVIRKGVPDTYRREVWTAITQCTEALASSSCRPYREKLASVFGSAITAPPKISDPPTFCGNLDPKCHYVTDDGIEAAKRILVLIAMDHPDIQCCPAIPDCVLLLLTFLTEHEVYLAMRYMIAVSVKSRLYFNVVAQHSSSFLSAFGSLVRKKLPKVTKMMLLAGVDLDFVAMTWFNSLFVGHLPFHTVLRMFDVFLNEGSKILLRVGLGVLSLSQPYLENIVDQAEFIQRLATVAISQVDADVLMKTAFKFKLSRGSYISSSIDAMAKLGGGPPASTSKTPASFVYYMPRIDFVSTVVSSEMFERLWSFLPQRFAIMDPVRLFCADADGFSLPTLIHRSMKSEPLLLALKAKGQVFGVYMSRSFSNLKKNQISGDGETFLWSLTPTPGKYEWTRADELFVFYDNKTLSFGIHGNATGLWLENELSGGSQSSPTYNNPPLCITTTGTGTPTYASRALSTTTGDRRRMEEYEFECTAAEVFTFM